MFILFMKMHISTYILCMLLPCRKNAVDKAFQKNRVDKKKISCYLVSLLRY